MLVQCLDRPAKNMIEVLLIVTLLLLLVIVAMQVLLLRKKVGIDLSPVEGALKSVEQSYDRSERVVREEIARNRQEGAQEAQSSRQEFAAALKGTGDTLNRQHAATAHSNDQKLEQMRQTIEHRLQTIQESGAQKLDQVRQDSVSSAKSLRDEIGATLRGFNESLVTTFDALGHAQKTQLALFGEQLEKLTQSNAQKLDALKLGVEAKLKELQDDSGKRLDGVRNDSATSAKSLRDEISLALRGFNDSLIKTFDAMGHQQRQQLGLFGERLDKLTQSNEQKLDALKLAVEAKLKSLQDDNAKQLDQMRQTVDEKLQGTLDKRLGESFKQVSERLEAVYKGLGEMQVLAVGVGDLKKVLTNVKTRGTWGEVQLGAMLEQVLTPEQYATNVCTKDGGERVEFVVKLPGRSENLDEIVWLPLDAKFPVEDYQRLIDAQEKADGDAAEIAAKALEIRIKACAKDICEKYLNPPKTTDFGILFLPTEGLFAEVVRRTGLAEFVQRECRVVIAGPTTLWSILNSLQMGFRTLAIQKRSSEVWNLLAAVKTEWSKYGGVLQKVQKKLQEVSNTIDDAEKRVRVVGRKLKGVQELPATEAKEVLMLGDSTFADSEEEDASPASLPADA